MSPQLQALRLTRYDRAMLFGAGPENGGLGFRKGSAPNVSNTSGTHYKRKGRSPTYGAVRALAERVVAGEFPGLPYPDVIDAENRRLKEAGQPPIQFDDQSLKNTIWKVRNGWREKPRREQRRRVAA